MEIKELSDEQLQYLFPVAERAVIKGGDTLLQTIARHEEERDQVMKVIYDQESSQSYPDRASNNMLEYHLSGLNILINSAKSGDELDINLAHKIGLSDVDRDMLSQLPYIDKLLEESGDSRRRLKSCHLWIGDPLEGSSGFPDKDFYVMLALTEGLTKGQRNKQNPIMGIIYNPLTGEIWHAIRNRGAYKRVADRNKLNNKMLRDDIGTPLWGPEKQLYTSGIEDLHYMRVVVSSVANKTRKYRQLVERLAEHEHVRGFRSLTYAPTTAKKMLMLAEGEAELYLYYNPNRYNAEYDTCAPDIMLREAARAAGSRQKILVRSLDAVPMLYNKKEINNIDGVMAANGFIPTKRLVSVVKNTYNHLGD